MAAPILGARGLSFRAVALLGLGEGEFPRPLPHDPLLRQPDRERLAERDVMLEIRDAGDQVTLFYEAATRAHTRLLVTRPYLTDDGQPWEPSPYWEQLQQHSGVQPVVVRAADGLLTAGCGLDGGISGRSGPAQRTGLVACSPTCLKRPTLHSGWRQVQGGRGGAGRTSGRTGAWPV